jgi:hypothetical protein
LPKNSFTVVGCGIYPVGSIVSYSWTKQSGPQQGNIESPTSATTNLTGLVQGTYVFRLIVTDNGNPAANGFDDVTVIVNGSPTTITNYKINAGGPDVTTSIGAFTADNFYSPSPGFIYSTTQPINGTADDALYQTERSATAANGTFSYALPISNGTYTVVLHFAEIYQTAINTRLFDVSIEGVKVLDNYDIFKKVGNFTATTETFNTTVSDGVLDVFFSALTADGGVDRPKVSAIEIKPVTTAPVASLDNETLRATTSTQSGSVIAYPNPSFDGRYKVVLPKVFEGELTYSLVSSTGSALVTGKLNLLKPTSVLDFNFSQQMQKDGIYYLRMNSKSGQLNLKLARVNK